MCYWQDSGELEESRVEREVE